MTHDQDHVAKVVTRGRQYQSQHAFALLAGVVIVGVTAFAAARLFAPATGASGSTWAGVLAAIIFFILLAAFIARRTAASVEPQRSRSIVSAEPARRIPSIPASDTSAQGGVIICCSGGGVKSASFCMGALQRLKDQADLWKEVDTVVGVSGGGYVASAWAVADHRSEAGSTTPVWAPDRLEALRARTNYLASSGRARFDLTCSILFGVVLNLVLLVGPLVTVAWLVGGYAVDSGLDASAKMVTWANWWVLTPSLFLVLVAVIIFLSKQLDWATGAVSSRVLRRLERAYWRLVAGRAAAGDDSERLRFFAEVPNTLVGAAVGYAVAVPALIWTAKNYIHAVRDVGTLVDYILANKDTISWILGVLVAMVGLSHSGARSKATDGGPIGTAWHLLRRQIAPWVAVLIIAGFGYWVAAILTAREMRSPLTGWWAMGAAAAIVVLPSIVGLVGSANATSMFGFYRDRLAYAYLGPAWEDSRGARAARPASPADLSLAAVTAGSVHPELVLMATANAHGAGYLPTGRNGTPFILSSDVGFPGSIGPYPMATEPAGKYKLERRRPITIAEAMAISGAALSPQAGRESKNLGGYRILLALANVRLGAWAPNPYFCNLPPAPSQNRWRRACLSLSAALDRHTALHVVQEAFGALRLDTPYVYLTDGGHYDNLGLVEALRRRPRRIYLLDGTGDAEDSFAAVGDAIATARMDLGVEVDFPDPDLVRRNGRKYPAQAWTTMLATDPKVDEWECEITYIKAILPDNFTFDLYAFQARNPGFPTELGRIEMLDEFDFEAYRQLGWCATHSALMLVDAPEAER